MVISSNTLKEDVIFLLIPPLACDVWEDIIIAQHKIYENERREEDDELK